MDLSGALLYLIGADAAQIQPSADIVELPYDAYQALDGRLLWDQGPVIGYINSLDEEYDQSIYGPKHRYGPYAPPGDTAETWNEGQMVPRSNGMTQSLSDQCGRWSNLFRRYDTPLVEIDNPDSYSLQDAIWARDFVLGRGLNVIAKNPCLIEDGAGDYAEYVDHRNVLGCIVESGCGNAQQMQALRKAINRLTLPVWFVFNRNEKPMADGRVAEIDQAKYTNMSVTWSPTHDDYGGAEVLLRPLS
jgi:hypothetical protein